MPAPLDIEIYRGDTYELYFRLRTMTWNPALNGGAGGWEAGPYMNLTGYTIASQIRVTKTAASAVATFTPTISPQGAPETVGGCLLSLTPAETTAITADAGVWDLEVTNPSGKKKTYLGGAVTIEGDVTR